MQRLHRIARQRPSTGTDHIGGLLAADPVEGIPSGEATTLREQVSVYGAPAQPLKIANDLTSAGSLYPLDGSGILPSSPATDGGNTLVLDTGVPTDASLDYVGLLVAILSGSAAGEVRDISGWNSGTKTVTLRAPAPQASAWVTGKVPAAGDRYALLVDCRYLNALHVIPECNATANTLTWAALLCSFPLQTNGAGAVGFRFGWAAPVTTTPLGFQPGTPYIMETSAYVSQVDTIDTRGFLGAKLRVQALDGGQWSLWAVTT